MCYMNLRLTYILTFLLSYLRDYKIIILDSDIVLLDVIDPEKKKKLDDAAEPGDIWHGDDDDGDGGGGVERGKGMASRNVTIFLYFFLHFDSFLILKSMMMMMMSCFCFVLQGCNKHCFVLSICMLLSPIFVHHFIPVHLTD